MKYDLKKLKTALTKKQSFLTAEDFDNYWDSTKNFANFLARLLKNKVVSDEQLNTVLKELYNIKYVNLGGILIPPNILHQIPKDFSVEHDIVVFGETDGGALKVAMVDPSDLFAIEYIRKRTKREVDIYLTNLESIQSIIRGYKSDIQNLFSDAISSGDRTSLVGQENQDLKELAKGVPITKAVNSIIEYAVTEETSDIHIEPTENEVVIRFRIDGILHDMLILLKSIHPLLVARIKIMADLKIDEHRRPQDGRIKMQVNDIPISLRVSILPTYHGEKIVMRILDESVKDFGLKDLGIAGKEFTAIQEAINRPDGMLLVTGPTGSGKTTTLYTIMRILNTPEVNINTIEDPIEYSMKRISQSQVNSGIGFTFANGLRTLLRQDPDIIMVGEIRDEETAGMAIHSAMTGHLVLSTLHTNDAPGAIPRFVDMGAEPFLLASTLNLAIAQRLIRKLCNDCKKKADMDKISRKTIEEQLADVPLPKEQKDKYLNMQIYQPGGCAKCGNSGYKGRKGIYEVLEVTDKVKEMIIEKLPSHKLKEEMIAQGHLPMFVSGLEDVFNGQSTLPEIMRVAQE